MGFSKGDPNINRKGRPTGAFSLVDMIRRELQKVPPQQQYSYAEGLVRKILQKGIIEGDHATQKLIMNYLEGMPKQSVDITTQNEKINSLAPDVIAFAEEELRRRKSNDE